MLKIYLDTCCYNRPFDDLTQFKIYHEANAVETIFSMYENNELEIYTSEAIVFEISNITNPAKKRQVQDLYSMLSLRETEYSESIKNRGIELRKYNIKELDALHIAFSENSEADWFITTDKFLLNVSARINIKTKIINPINFIMEV